MRHTEHGSGLGRWRSVVERTFAWLGQFRRLRVRYDKRADINEAFLSRVRDDLLASAAQDVENHLRPMPSFPFFRRKCVHASAWPPLGQALDIGLHYAVTQE